MLCTTVPVRPTELEMPALAPMLKDSFRLLALTETSPPAQLKVAPLATVELLFWVSSSRT